MTLPFAWRDVRVQVPGATELRVRWVRDAAGSYSLDLADGAGRDIGHIGDLRLRAATGAAVRRQNSDDLYRVEWPRASLPEHARPLTVLGVGEQVPDAERFATRVDLTEWLDAGGAAPEIVVVDGARPGTGDLGSAAEARTGEVLELIQWWLGEARLTESALVVVTRGAVSTGAAEDVDVTSGARVGAVACGAGGASGS